MRIYEKYVLSLVAFSTIRGFASECIFMQNKLGKSLSIKRIYSLFLSDMISFFHFSLVVLFFYITFAHK